MYSRSFEFVTIGSLWPNSFAKWYESKHKVQNIVDWKLNYKVVYVGKKNRRKSVFTGKKITRIDTNFF